MHQCLVCHQLFENFSSPDEDAASHMFLPDIGPFDFELSSKSLLTCQEKPELWSSTDVLFQLSRVLRVEVSLFDAAKALEEGKDQPLREILCPTCCSLFEDSQLFEKRLKDTLVRLRNRVHVTSRENSSHCHVDKGEAPHDWVGLDVDVLSGDEDLLADFESFQGKNDRSSPMPDSLERDVAGPSEDDEPVESGDRLAVSGQDRPTDKQADLLKLEKLRNPRAIVLRSIGVQRSFDDPEKDTVEEDESRSCSICFASFNRIKNIAKHLALHNGPSNRCPKCDRAFVSEEKYHMHLVGCVFSPRLINGDQPGPGDEISCEICGKTIVGLEAYRGHLLRSHLGRVHSCKQCSKTFARKNELLRHIGAAHRDVKFTCEDCGKSFSYRSDHDRHRREVHAPPGNAFRCKACGKKFKSQRLLTDHVAKFHSNDHLWRICEGCGERGYFGTGNDNHYRKCAVSNANNPCNCPVCGKKFETPAKLKSHETACKTPKRFECNVCGKSFKFKCRLTAHIATHVHLPTSTSDLRPPAVDESHASSAISESMDEKTPVVVSSVEREITDDEAHQRLNLMSSLHSPPMDLFSL